MINTISHIPAGIKEGISRIPRSKNRVVDGVRTLVVLTLLAPGSCVGASAAGSWVYSKINGISTPVDMEFNEQNSEKETDPFIYEDLFSDNEK